MPRILIAEDFREIRNLIIQVLSGDGYEIDAVTNGDEAIQKLSAQDYDAILLDFMMPVASGRDVLDWMAENRPELAQACVIIITAAMRELGQLDASTVYASIAKPFEIDHLRDTVRNCVRDRGAATAAS
ncbi:MAG TPA: response regulator [Thermoanaerobaculia bacterium]|nr:response regulator [Thermoanaerobaculia bacterium]